MALSQQNHKSHPSRVEALKERHAFLSDLLLEKMKHPATSDLDLRRIKIKKLKIKEEIEGIRETS